MALPRTVFVLLILLFSSVRALVAQTQVEISWGSSLFEQKMILNDGTDLDPNNLIIELGSFDNSFTPDHTNMSRWLSEWRVFDAITDSDPGVGTTDSDPRDAFTNASGGSESARYSGAAHLLADSTSDSEDANPFYTWSPGEQAYLFIRTSDDFVEGSEWLLLTSFNETRHVGDSVWEFPAVTGDQPQFSLAWWLDDADKAVFGAFGGGDPGGGDTGLGGFSDTSTDFALRLHNIPEPGPATLALITTFILILPRQR